VRVIGSNDKATIAAGANLILYGSNDSIAATTGDGISVNSGTGEMITGAGFTVYGVAGTGFTVGGNGLAVKRILVDASSASAGLQASSNMSLTSGEFEHEPDRVE